MDFWMSLHNNDRDIRLAMDFWMSLHNDDRDIRLNKAQLLPVRVQRMNETFTFKKLWQDRAEMYTFAASVMLQ